MKSKASQLLESIPNFTLYKSTLEYNPNLSLLQMLRDSIIGEIDTVSLYDLQISSISDPEIKKVLTSIRDEEISHIGELYSLVKRVSPSVDSKISSGENEVRELILKSNLDISLD